MMTSLFGTWVSSLRQSTFAILERLTLMPSTIALLGIRLSFSRMTVCDSIVRCFFCYPLQNYTFFLMQVALFHIIPNFAI